MIDRISKTHRSWNMRQIRSKDTKPEIIVRRLLFALGYRFRLHGKVNKRLCKSGILPGKPDIVLKKYKTVIFVHGCFWHRHQECKRATTPKSHIKYWKNKFTRNAERDKQNQRLLKALNWHVITVWECEALNFVKETRKTAIKKTALAQYLQSELSPSVFDQASPDYELQVAEKNQDYCLQKTFSTRPDKK